MVCLMENGVDWVRLFIGISLFCETAISAISSSSRRIVELWVLDTETEKVYYRSMKTEIILYKSFTHQ